MNSHRASLEAASLLTVMYTLDIPTPVLEFLLRFRYYEYAPDLPHVFVRRVRAFPPGNLYTVFLGWLEDQHPPVIDVREGEHIQVPDDWVLSINPEDDVPGVVFGATIYAHPSIEMVTSNTAKVTIGRTEQERSILWTFRSTNQFLVRAQQNGRVVFAMKGVPTTRGWVRSRTD